MGVHRTPFGEKSTMQQIDDMHRRRKPNKLIRLLMLAAVLIGFLAGCDDKGQPCNHVGDSKYYSKNQETLHCKYDPTTGGNTWQSLIGSRK